MARYFTERHGQPVPRAKEFLDGDIKGALLRLVQTRIGANSFGESFPDQCPDGRGNSGVNETALRDVMRGYRIIWPADVQRLDDDETSDRQLFDLLEFSYEHIQNPFRAKITLTSDITTTHTSAIRAGEDLPTR